MKKIILFLFVCLNSVILFGQNDSIAFNDNTKAYIWVEEMPVYSGGEDTLKKHIQQNLEYPEIYSECSIQGTVYLRFIVLTNGCVDSTSIQIVRGVDPLLDNEAIKAVKHLQFSKPAYHNGKPVKFWFNVPVEFKL
jgi:TonB family protein